MGQDELIRRISENHKTIEFIPQTVHERKKYHEMAKTSEAVNTSFTRFSDC